MNRFFKELDRIEFIVTMGCTGRCRHCSEGSHEFGGEHIDGAVAAAAVEQICSAYRISSLMTFGGEPLLYPETVCAIHRAAVKCGIKYRDVITNGYFSKDNKRIEEVAEMLAESGVNRVLLSVDAFHQETIPLGPVEHFANAMKKKGVLTEISPAWLVSRTHDNPYNAVTKELVEKFAGIGFEVGDGNIIFPSGNALKYLSEYMNETTAENPYEDDPENIRSVGFSPDGSVLGGNIYQTPILEIMENYSP